MNDKRRSLWIGILVVFASVSLAAVGLPYQPLQVMASDLRQYQPTGTPIVPCLSIGDQDASAGSVRADRVCATRRAWVVIYQDQAGVPGAPIGMTLVPLGVSNDVIIEIALDQVTPQLFAQVHQDLGEAEVFEPADPVESGPVAFNVTTGEPVATAAVQATATQTSAPTLTATPTATPEPAGLASLPPALILAVLCLAFLLGLGLIALALLPMIRRRLE